MRKWHTNPTGAALMVLLWTLGWGLGYGGFVEAFIDPHGEIEDVWLTVLAIPGFISGLVFVVLLRLAEGRRTFDAIAFPRLAAWGALAGLVVGLIGLAIGLASDPFGLAGLYLLAAAVGLGVLAALITAALFRFLARSPGPTATNHA